MLIVNSRVRIPDDELVWSFARSGGPGGQNVNKVNSKAIVHWAIATSPALPDDVRARFLTRFASRITTEGQLVISSQRYRDQGRNIDDCREKLREMLAAVATAPRKRRATRPTKASRVRKRKSKERNSQRKQSRQAVRDQ